MLSGASSSRKSSHQSCWLVTAWAGQWQLDVRPARYLSEPLAKRNTECCCSLQQRAEAAWSCTTLYCSCACTASKTMPGCNQGKAYAVTRLGPTIMFSSLAARTSMPICLHIHHNCYQSCAGKATRHTCKVPACISCPCMYQDGAPPLVLGCFWVQRLLS